MLKPIVHSDSDASISIPLGIFVGLLASFVQSLGLTIQRKSHVQNQALPEGEQKVEHRRPLWLLGFGIFISSNLFGSIFQIASLPVVILAPLGAVSLLWNAFFARLILGDVFSPWMALSTLCIAGGAVLIAIFGIVPEPRHSLEDLLELFSRPAFVIYFSLLGVVTVVCLAITHIMEYHSTGRMALPADTPPLSPLLAPNTDPTLLTGLPDPSAESDVNGHVSEHVPLLDPKVSLSKPSSIASYISPSNIPTFLAMSYASFSGIISGMCLLFAKSGLELLLLTLGGKNQFWRWQAWVLVLGLIVCALLQLWYMHKSLVLADPTIICPLAFCFYNLSAIINGLVYFDQFSVLSTTNLCLVILGLAILLAGVWIVSFPPSGNKGIDLVAWDELDDSIHDGSDVEGVHEHYEDEPLPMGDVSPSNTRIILQDGSGVVASPQTEPNTSTLHINTQVPEVIYSTPDGWAGDSPTSTRERRRTDSALLIDTTLPMTHSLSQHTQASATKRHRPTISSSQRDGNSFGKRQSFPPYANPLSPGTPGGFSIGLSAMSPGFALVPTERGRRRRVTSTSGTIRLADDDEGDVERGHALGTPKSIRRAPSVGSVRGSVDAGVQGDAEAQTGGVNVDTDGAKGRWRLLPRIFRSRRS